MKTKTNVCRRAMASVVMTLCCLVGCQGTTRSDASAPATDERLEQLRAIYAAERPGSIVGPVVAVMHEQFLAAIGDVPGDAFADGDLVSIIDSRQQTLAVGRVVRRLDQSVHVKYQPQPKMRAPREGDIGVRFPSTR